MSGKVISLTGGEVPLPGTPNVDVIDILEKSLEMARSGEIKGVVLIRTHADDLPTADRGGYITRSAIGLLEQVKVEILIEKINEK